MTPLTFSISGRGGQITTTSYRILGDDTDQSNSIGFVGQVKQVKILGGLAVADVRPIPKPSAQEALVWDC